MPRRFTPLPHQKTGQMTTRHLSFFSADPGQRRDRTPMTEAVGGSPHTATRRHQPAYHSRLTLISDEPIDRKLLVEELSDGQAVPRASIVPRPKPGTSELARPASTAASRGGENQDCIERRSRPPCCSSLLL